ncbi:MAG TPA: hypothetical protein DDZ41_08090, partial [Flavobacterium sp.]|nr:hypothetical protein [Flavobacterium sp.]
MFYKQIFCFAFCFQKQNTTRLILLKTSFLVFFFFLGLSGFAQTTSYKKELYFSVEIAEVLKIISSKTDLYYTTGIKSDKKEAYIKVSIYDKEKYESLPENDKTKAFMYGFRNRPYTEQNVEFQVFPFELTPRNRWDCYWNKCDDPFVDDTGTLLYDSNDIRMFKKALIAKKEELHQFYFIDTNPLELNKYDASSGIYKSGLEREYCNVIVVIEIVSENPAYPAELNRVQAIRIPGIGEFNPNNSRTVAIDVYRESKTIPVESIVIYNDYQNLIKNLSVFEGDSLVFKSKDPCKIAGLTDISIMRWAGESIYMANYIKEGMHKPFLFYDSNVHGIKLRTYPEEWNKPSFGSKAKYPVWEKENPLISNEYKYYWIANTRRDLLKEFTDTELNSNVVLSPYKSAYDFKQALPENFPADGFPNSNKFSGFTEFIYEQRNNQKEGL